jgi:DNA polymerase III alpha subunit
MFTRIIPFWTVRLPLRVWSIKRIKDGMKAMALTDHGNMFGIKDFIIISLKRTKERRQVTGSNPSSGVKYMWHEMACFNSEKRSRKTPEAGT